MRNDFLPLFDSVADLRPDLATYDWILVNTSGGKDSMVALKRTIEAADAVGFARNRIVVVHADLGSMEWDGVVDLAGEHAAHYGLRFEVVRNNTHRDLLAYVEKRGMWPGPTTRYCTSDFKTSPIRTLMTRLANELHGNVRESKKNRSKLGRPVRILNVMGMRAEESPKRAKLTPFAFSHGNSRRHVDDWLPIHHLKEAEVWEEIDRSGMRYHDAYDRGMPRLSCAFCIFASRDALLIAGEAKPALLDRYVEVEEKIGHKFRVDLPIVEIKNALENGERGDATKCVSCPWAA